MLKKELAGRTLPKETLENEIDRLLRDGITADEVELAKSGIVDGLIFARDNVMGLARRVGNGLSIGMTVEEVTSLSDRMKAVTVERVNEAARRVFDKRRSVTGMLLPSPVAPTPPATVTPATAVAR